jgi:DNA-binding protein HU-beta
MKTPPGPERPGGRFFPGNPRVSAPPAVDAREILSLGFTAIRGSRRGCGNLGGYAVNKNDLVAKVAGHSGLSKQDATKAVDSVLECITDALKDGDEVRLVGFGTFAVTEREATTGRNPRTGESIDIPASKSPKFRPGKQLKDTLNG